MCIFGDIPLSSYKIFPYNNLFPYSIFAFDKQSMNMTHKERFFATINREVIDRPASWLGLPVPAALPGLFKYFNVSTIEELKYKTDDDIFPVIVPYNNPPFNDIGCALNFRKDGDGGSQDERTLTAPGFLKI